MLSEASVLIICVLIRMACADLLDDDFSISSATERRLVAVFSDEFDRHDAQMLQCFIVEDPSVDFCPAQNGRTRSLCSLHQ